MEIHNLQCQSCGMPLNGEEILGTDANGSPNKEYCKYCYENGQFTQAEFSMEDMVSFCVPFLVEEGMEESKARGILNDSLPSLKRWSRPEAVANIPAFKVVELDELTLVGITARTTNKQEMGENAKIGALWGRFWSEGIQQSISSGQATVSQNIYGLYSDYEDGANGEYTVLVGCKADGIADSQKDLTAKRLPASRYAVFTTKKGPISKVVIEAWQSIWRLSADSKLKRTFSGDFELYDERSADPENAQVDIYIAI